MAEGNTLPLPFLCFVQTFEKGLDSGAVIRYNPNRCEGAWCNGNTWVSKTFVEGSNPSAPAQTGAITSFAGGVESVFLRSETKRPLLKTIR